MVEVRWICHDSAMSQIKIVNAELQQCAIGIILQHRWTHSKVRRCGEWEIRCLRLDALVKWQCNRQGQKETGDWSPHVPCRGTYGEGTKWKLLHRVHSLKYITAKETLPLVSVRTGSRESSSACTARTQLLKSSSYVYSDSQTYG